MNDYARRRILGDRMRGDSRRRDYADTRDYRDMRDYGDMRSSRDYYGGDMRDYAYEEDYRRGDRAYEYDGHSSELELTKHDMMAWKRHLMNADGSTGERFKFDEIMDVAEKMRLKFRGYTEKDLCMAVNMLYSDFCKALKQVIPPDKELYIYVAMADAFLNDEDGPEGSEKLALYYHCIVKENG